MGVPTLLYDEGCGFCRWSVDKILRWGRLDRLRAVAIQSAEADELLGDMDPVAKLDSAHLVTFDGKIHSAGALVDPLLRTLPGGAALAAVARSMPKATDRMYRLVARNRTRIGGWLGADACRVDPEHQSGRTRRPR
jgi:predicted DCC family thiol-disulfide oxidoreductase YuxK